MNKSESKIQWLDGMINQIAVEYPSQKQLLSLYQALTETEKTDFATTLQCIQDRYQMPDDDIIRGYRIITDDVLEEHRYFVETGHYRCHTFQEADAYMASKAPHYMRYYQIGLLISSFVWPNHFEMRKHFLQIIENAKGKNYLEIGIGHGMYFGMALLHSHFDFYLGLDINPDSLEMAKTVIAQKQGATERNYALELCDFYTMPEHRVFDVIVAGEVLEHIEDPLGFLQKASRLSHQDTLIYMTTAINAPAVDHIYLFQNPEELHALFATAGLHITHMELYPYQNRSIEASLRKKLPVTVSIEARKA